MDSIDIEPPNHAAKFNKINWYNYFQNNPTNQHKDKTPPFKQYSHPSEIKTFTPDDRDTLIPFYFNIDDDMITLIKYFFHFCFFLVTFLSSSPPSIYRVPLPLHLQRALLSLLFSSRDRFFIFFSFLIFFIVLTK